MIHWVWVSYFRFSSLWDSVEVQSDCAFYNLYNHLANNLVFMPNFPHKRFRIMCVCGGGGWVGAFINLHLSVSLPTCKLWQWWAAGCQQRCSGSDLNCEGRNVSEQRAELQGKRGSGLHRLVIRTLPRCCTSDRFLQSWGHIITFTHFCPVSRSTKASQCWVGQWKKMQFKKRYHQVHNIK